MVLIWKDDTQGGGTLATFLNIFCRLETMVFRKVWIPQIGRGIREASTDSIWYKVEGSSYVKQEQINLFNLDIKEKNVTLSK